MNEQFLRLQAQIGSDGLERLRMSRVAVFGIGGVGGYAAEALARAGVGRLDIIDADRVCVTNINRQIAATHSVIGEYKVDVMRARILDINPEALVNVYRLFYMPDNAGELDLNAYDCVADAVDTITAKLTLVSRACACGTPVISCMGAGNKTDITALTAADIYDTTVCPMARVMRRELKKRGIAALRVVYSTEPACSPKEKAEQDCMTCAYYEKCKPFLLDTIKPKKRQTPASNSFVPPAAGLLMAGEIIKCLISEPPPKPREHME